MSIVVSLISARQASRHLRTELHDRDQERERTATRASAETDKKMALENQARDQVICSTKSSCDAAHDKIRQMQTDANKTNRELSEIHSEIRAITQALIEIKTFMECEKNDMEIMKRDLAVHIVQGGPR